MSLVARARRAALAARDGLDAVREAQAATRAASAHDADEAGPWALGRALALGAPDPRALLGRERAEAVAGVALHGPQLTSADDAVGVRWTGGGWELSLAAFHAADEADAPFDAAARWWGFVQPVLADEAVPVPGLGRAALAHADCVYVLAPPHLLVATVRAPEGADARAAAVALLRDALSSA